MKKKVVLSVAVVLLLVMVAAMCVACTPNADNLQKKLEKKGYTVDVEKVGVDGVEKMLMAGKGTDEFLTVVWYSDSKKQNEAYKNAKETYKDNDKVKVSKKGKAIVAGTKNAVKLV